MALNDTAFKTAIIALQDDLNQRLDYDTAKIEYAEKLMQAVKNYIKSGTVSVTVSTTGTASSHTGTGTGNIS